MGIQKSAIDLGIITNNLDAMLNFYGEQLGLEVETVIDMPGGGVMHRFKVGDSIVKVIETDPSSRSWRHSRGNRVSLLDSAHQRS